MKDAAEVLAWIRARPILAAVILFVGPSLLGYAAASAATGLTRPEFAATVIRSGQTQVVTHTRVIKKVVRGRVVKLRGGARVILVSRVVIRNLKCHPTRRHHCVRRVVVPAHTIPLRAATIHQAVAVAAPLVPVTVYVTIPGPTTTETLPAQTVTATETETTTAPGTTITVTVPVSP
jgi:hypothetical protein